MVMVGGGSVARVEVVKRTTVSTVIASNVAFGYCARSMPTTISNLKGEYILVTTHSIQFWRSSVLKGSS